MTTETALKQTRNKSIKAYFPIVDWLPTYQKSWLRVDIIAAFTLWALPVPEAMAYADIAGMPPETGLYAAPLALIAYAIFGTSRHLTVGPSSAVAALLGIIVLLFRTKQRNTFVIAKVPETNIYRSLAHYPEGETYPGLLILRFDGSLFFANAHDFVTAVREVIAKADPLPQVILFDCESMNQIDATAVITIKEFHNQLAQSNIQVRLARVKTAVSDVMQRGSLLETNSQSISTQRYKRPLMLIWPSKKNSPFSWGHRKYAEVSF